MDRKFQSLLSLVIIPHTVKLIVFNERLSDVAAINEFYFSKTYKMLAKEETKMWHYSPLTIYNMWKNEKEMGKLIWPEEGIYYA